MTYTNPFQVPGMSDADPLTPVTAADLTGGRDWDADDEEETTERKAAAPKGGYYTVGKKEYWFPGDLYEQVLAEDEQTPMTRKGDKQFAKWIKAFIKQYEDRITLVQKQSRSRHYGGGYGMSGYWAMPYTYKGANADTARLATILRAMKTVLSVVDPMHRLSVRYTDEGTSYWMDNNVSLPLKPAKEITDLEEAINVEGGFAVHEAFHSDDTRPMVDFVMKDWLKRDGWNRLLTNIAEDVRIEENGLRKTPGFREYLNFVSEYLWDDKKAVKSYPEGPEGLQDRAQTFFVLTREPDRVEDVMTDPSFDAPRQWFADWIKRYVEEVNANRNFFVVQRLINELKEYLEVPPTPDPETQPGKTLMIMTPCGYVADDKGMSVEGQEEVAEAIEAETEEVSDSDWAKIFGEAKKPARDSYLVFGNNGDYMGACIIRKPRVKNPDLFKPIRGGLVDKAKAALNLRKAVAQADTRLMKSGVLDEDELHRFFQGDMRFFKDTTVETIPDAALYLLIDMSGSMGDPHYDWTSAYYAVQVAQTFVEGFKDHANVRVRVLGHTGDNTDCPEGGAFYRIWEQGDPISRLSLMYDRVEIQQGGNYDGYAIAWAGQLIKQEPVEQRLLMVLSDGQPNGETGYGQEAGRAHVRSITDRLLRQGVDVVQVAVGKDIAREYQQEMFKHFIEMRDDGEGDPFNTVFRKLTKLLTKFT